MSSDRIIIIGAGAAGSAAAYALHKAGKQCLVLEAQNRTGGRVHTHDFGFPVDLGASYIHGFDNEANPTKKLAAELGVEHYIAQPEPGQVFSFDGKRVDGPTLGNVTSQIAEKSKQVTEPIQKESGSRDVSFGSALIPQLDAPFAEGMARVSEIGGGIRMENMSAKFHNTQKAMLGVDAMPVNGYSSMFKKALDKSGAQVKLNQEVVSVKESDDGVHVTTKDGQTYQGSHVICTVPVAVLQQGKVQFDPPLPAKQQTAIDRASVGNLNKLLLIYPKAWWPEKAATFLILPSGPTSQSYSTPEDVLTGGPLFVSNLAAVAKEQPPALLCFLGAARGDAIEGFDTDQVAKAAHEVLSKILFNSNQETIVPPVKSFLTKWRSEPFSLGATTGPVAFGKNATPEDFNDLAEPCWSGKLLFAGEHTHIDWRGSVVGAVGSGNREAERLLASLSS